MVFLRISLENVMCELKNSDGNVFIIGMGVPKQELFAMKLSQLVNSKVIICVGNFLNPISGQREEPRY